MRGPTSIEITTQDDDLIASCSAAWTDSSTGGHVSMGGKKWSVVRVDYSVDHVNRYTETHMTVRIQLMELLEVQVETGSQRTLRDGRVPRALGRR